MIAKDIIKKAIGYGADAADTIMFDSTDLTVRQRLGKTETVERAESKGLGLRVLISEKNNGYKQAIVSTNDFNNIDALVEKAVAMAKAAPSDPYCGIADKSALATNFPDLDLCDDKEFSPEMLNELAKEAEESALSVKGITNSESVEVSCGKSSVTFATSNGFAKQYNTTSISLSASVIAGTGMKMETDYDYSVARHYSDLKSPSLIGKKAGERAVGKLNPEKIKSCQVPLIFEPRVAGTLVESFAEAINGVAIAKGTSFLKDKLGKQIFGNGINIYDDPLIVRGINSEPFDAEGIEKKKYALIDNGKLTTWLLDLRSAKQLGLKTTGHASRGLSSPPSPSPSNLYLDNGNVTPEELISGIKDGFYVTEAFGFGVNGVTGDYSQGASGFLIVNGEIATPVSEITIAGNLLDMFMNIVPANDLEFISTTNSPTVLIEGMTIAGR